MWAWFQEGRRARGTGHRRRTTEREDRRLRFLPLRWIRTKSCDYMELQLFAYRRHFVLLPPLSNDVAAWGGSDSYNSSWSSFILSVLASVFLFDHLKTRDRLRSPIANILRSLVKPRYFISLIMN